MVSNATFNTSSYCGGGVLLVEAESGVLEENHRQTLSHNVVSSTPHTFSVDRHIITTTTVRF